MKFLSVSFQNYKSLKGKHQINLDNKITVFVGANNSGKSNILQSFEKLINFNNQDIIVEPNLNIKIANKEYGTSIIVMLSIFSDELLQYDIRLSSPKSNNLIENYAVLLLEQNESVKVELNITNHVTPRETSGKSIIAKLFFDDSSISRERLINKCPNLIGMIQQYQNFESFYNESSELLITIIKNYLQTKDNSFKMLNSNFLISFQESMNPTLSFRNLDNLRSILAKLRQIKSS